MNEPELLASTQERIHQYRTGEIELHIQDSEGNALSNAPVEIRQRDHAFRFGSNAFVLESLEDQDLQQAYNQRFAALLNYATLPFYWGGYERSEGMTQEARLRRMAAWAQQHQIVTKGHPLVWHEVFPQWAHGYSDTEALVRLEQRVRRIVSEFKDCVTWWDVVNEAVVSHRFDNAVGRWMAQHSAAECVAQAFRWAHEANPEARLCYNDFNVSEDAQRLVGDLLDREVPVHILGIQSHMHKGTWSLERVWEVCETYARFGLPLHWTELTVLSGRRKSPDDNDWHRRHDDWVSTKEGEATQQQYVTQLYSLLFSHPAVEAITWWDFSDLHAWQGAPAGFLRKDMSPKPIYESLMARIHSEWHTDLKTRTDEAGCVRTRAFHGAYDVQVSSQIGVLKGQFSLQPGDEGTTTVPVY